MQRSIVRLAQYGLETQGTRGVAPWRQRVKDYKSFQSKFGPSYKTGYHLGGINMATAKQYGYLAAGMGGAAGVFALFFFNAVPRVQQDILQGIPFIGGFFKHEIAPEDNPF